MSVRVTNEDIVLLGHGSYQGGAKNFKLPENIDLYVSSPIGYVLMTDVAKALIQQREINKLVLYYDKITSGEIEPAVAVYRGGKLAPDLILHDLGDLTKWGKDTIGDKKNVVTVEKDTLLSELIQSNEKIKEASKGGRKLKLYWSACASQVSEYSASLG